MPLPNYSSQSVRATAPGRGTAPRVPTATFRGDVMNMGRGAPTQRLNIPQLDPATGLPSTFALPNANAGSAIGAPMPANPGIAAGPGVVQTGSFGQTGFPAMQQQAQAGQPPLPAPTIGPQQDLFGGTMFPGVLGSTGAGMETQPASNPLSPVPAAGPSNLFGNSQTGVAVPNVFPSLYPRARKAPPLYSQS